MKIELLSAAVSAQLQARGAANTLLKDGDILRALVEQTNEDGQLIIKLDGGNMLKALCAPGMDLAAGEMLMLQVCRQGQGKTQMQMLARDGGAGRSVNAREDLPQAQAGGGDASAGSRNSADNGVQAAAGDAVAELCRLVSEAPGLGKALQKMMQSFIVPPSDKEGVLPRLREQSTDQPPHHAADRTETPQPQGQSVRARPDAPQNAQKPVLAQPEPRMKDPAGGTVPVQAVAVTDAGAGHAPASGNTTGPQDAVAAGATPDAAENTPGTRDAAGQIPPQGEVRRSTPAQAVPLETVKTAAAQSPAARDTQDKPAAAGVPEPPELGEAFIRQVKAMFVRPDSPDFDGESLKRQLESLNERMAGLGQMAASAGLDSKAVTNQLENYTAQIRQLEHIQQFTYLQIPVMLREIESTAELYVFHRDRKGKPVDPGAAVVMLVLDTEHMGKVESVVRTENKNVHIRMRVEDERVARMLEGKTALLDRELAEAGYRLTQMACTLMDAPVTPQNAQEIAVHLLRDGTRRLDVVI